MLHVGCGTSFHAAQTGGRAAQALELVLDGATDADVLVCVSHEGGTELTLEAARAFHGERWLVTGKPDSPLGELCEHVDRDHAGGRGELVPHGQLHVRGRRACARCTGRT